MFCFVLPLIRDVDPSLAIMLTLSCLNPQASTHVHAQPHRLIFMHLDMSSSPIEDKSDSSVEF